MQSQNSRSLDGSCQSWWRPRRRRRQAALQRNSWNRNGISFERTVEERHAAWRRVQPLRALAHPRRIAVAEGRRRHCSASATARPPGAEGDRGREAAHAVADPVRNSATNAEFLPPGGERGEAHPLFWRAKHRAERRRPSEERPARTGRCGGRGRPSSAVPPSRPGSFLSHRRGRFHSHLPWMISKLRCHRSRSAMASGATRP